MKATPPASTLLAAAILLCLVSDFSRGQFVSMSPDFFIVGAPATTVTITGSGGTSFSPADWLKVTVMILPSYSNGWYYGTGGYYYLPVQYVNPTTLTATLPESLLGIRREGWVEVIDGYSGWPHFGFDDFSVGYPAPTLTSISPTCILPNATGILLTATGTGIFDETVIAINGWNLSTTIAGGVAYATLDFGGSGSQSVTLVNPSPGGGSSSPLTLDVSYSVSTVNSITPAFGLAGLPLTIDVFSDQIDDTSQVHWNGTALPTMMYYGWWWPALRAVVPPALNASVGTAQITIFNPGPCGGTSAPVTYAIVHAPPSVASISPASAPWGSAGMTLTVNGNQFVSTSVVRWNGFDLTTTFQSSTILTADVPSALLAVPGYGIVEVFTPPPGGGLSNQRWFYVYLPQVTLASISPTTVTASAGTFTLTVTGSMFTQFTRLELVYAGVSLGSFPTTLISSSALTATIQSGISVPGTVQVSVYNEYANSTPPASLPLVVGFPVPTMSAIYPDAVTAGGAEDLYLEVVGSGFYPASRVRWNGTDLLTWTWGPDRLLAYVSAASLASPGVASVTVFNPAPGGGTSSALAFSVNTPVNTLTAIAPVSATAGAAQTTLTATGTAFVGTSIVRWNGSDLATTFVSPTSLTAVVSAAHLATPGFPQVTVFNPPPGGGTSAPLTFTTNHPVPVLGAVAPPSIVMGAPQTTLTITGSGFFATSAVRWNGSDLATTLSGSTALTAVVPASSLASPATALVTVFNPLPGGGTSATVAFDVNAPAPTLSSITPTAVTAGAATGSLSVAGTGFLPSTVVRWNGSDLTTTFVSATALTATVPAAVLATPGLVLVTVFTPAPGGGMSPALTFTVNHPAPALYSCVPGNAVAGAAPAMLTLTGTGFFATSVVRWNGADLPAAYISGTSLTATVPAASLATPGTAQVTVFNPAPGGGTSNAVPFTILYPTPVVTVLAPATFVAGSGPATLTVTGTGYVPASVVRWHGADLPTTFVSPTTPTAVVSAANLATQGSKIVQVVNPPPGGGASAFTSITITAPVPVLGSVTPSSLTWGTPLSTLTLTGTGFLPTSTVYWNNATPLPTTFVSGTTLTATVTEAVLNASGSANTVRVLNPSPGGGWSETQPVSLGYPLPVLASLSPASATVGSPSVTVTVTGSGFNQLSVVRWNAMIVQTIYLGPTSLSFVAQDFQLATAGTASVTVSNPSPGGGTSAPITFEIGHPAPVLATIAPSSAPEGSPQTVVTLTGSGFVFTSVARWNGSTLATTHQGATSLTAVVPASFLATAGTAVVTVTTPAPGGGTSSGVPFTIDPLPLSIGSLSPSQAIAGWPGFTLTIGGTGFTSGSVVHWNGGALPTTFLPGSGGSPAILEASVAGSLIAAPGTALVTVANPPPNPATSNDVGFVIDTSNIAAASPVTIPVMVPTSSPVSLTLIAGGGGFAGTAVVVADGQVLPVTAVGSHGTSITCTLGPSVPGTLRPGGLTINVQNDAAAPLSLSNSWPLPVGTSLGNGGNIRTQPLVPVPGQNFGAVLENGAANQLFSLYADAENPAPVAAWPNAVGDMVLSVGPLVGSGMLFAPVIEGIGIFGPATGATLDGRGRFEMPPVLQLPSPPVGVSITVQGVFLDPQAPLGVRLTWARFPLTL